MDERTREKHRLYQRAYFAKPENRVKRSAYTRANRDRLTSYTLKREYGITLEQREILRAHQGGCCAVCGADKAGADGRDFHVDHDHVLGEVRGLLCARCNMGIGHFNDDPTMLEAAARYLRGPRLFEVLILHRRKQIGG